MDGQVGQPTNADQRGHMHITYRHLMITQCEELAYFMLLRLHGIHNSYEIRLHEPFCLAVYHKDTTPMLGIDSLNCHLRGTKETHSLNNT